MRQVLAVSKTRRFPSASQWLHARRVLPGAEKRILAGAGSVVALTIVFLVGAFVFAHRTDVPAVGGAYTEALIGEPSFINPLYAPANDVDADLARLVYSGLLRRDASEHLVNDLATDVKTSDDGKTYTVTLRADAYFHNGNPVLPKDVLFTFDALKDPLYRSPLAAAYQNVDVSQTNDRTVVFALKEPYAYFPSLLTVGILPSDLWSEVAPRNTPLASYNRKPVGSGPYLFKEFTKDKNGTVRTYTLARNPDYYGPKANIATLTFKFYDDAATAAKALESRNVEGIAYVPPELETEVQKTKVVLLRPEISRETTLFFNQERQAIFKTKAVRQAIALAIDRQAVIDAALNGHGTPVASPVLAEALLPADVASVPAPDIAAANALLDGAGFPRQEGGGVRIVKPPAPAKGKKTAVPSTVRELSFTLTTVQAPEFVQAAQAIAMELAPIGINVQIDAVNPEDLLKTTLEPRNYELLLTGLLYGNEPDPYPFWHSSQATSQGLNLADYANKKADDALTLARQTIDPAARAKAYAAFQAQILEDVPAVFLYRPTYTYAVGTKVKGIAIDRISLPSDRFADIINWYVKTRQVVK